MRPPRRDPKKAGAEEQRREQGEEQELQAYLRRGWGGSEPLGSPFADSVVDEAQAVVVMKALEALFEKQIRRGRGAAALIPRHLVESMHRFAQHRRREMRWLLRRRKLRSATPAELSEYIEKESEEEGRRRRVLEENRERRDRAQDTVESLRAELREAEDAARRFRSRIDWGFELMDRERHTNAQSEKGGILRLACYATGARQLKSHDLAHMLRRLGRTFLAWIGILRACQVGVFVEPEDEDDEQSAHLVAYIKLPREVCANADARVALRGRIQRACFQDTGLARDLTAIIAERLPVEIHEFQAPLLYDGVLLQVPPAFARGTRNLGLQPAGELPHLVRIHALGAGGWSERLGGRVGDALLWLDRKPASEMDTPALARVLAVRRPLQIYGGRLSTEATLAWEREVSAAAARTSPYGAAGPVHF